MVQKESKFVRAMDKVIKEYFPLIYIPVMIAGAIHMGVTLDRVSKNINSTYQDSTNIAKNTDGSRIETILESTPSDTFNWDRKNRQYDMGE